MSESKRFILLADCFVCEQGEYSAVQDTRLDRLFFVREDDSQDLCDLLNKQQDTISALKEENEELHRVINAEKKIEDEVVEINDEYVTCEQKFSCNNCKYHKDEKRDDIEHFSYPYSYCERKRCRLGSKERNWEGSWEECRYTCFVPNEQTKRYIHNSY